MPAEELFSAPSDLTLVGDDELRELETRGVAEFDRVNALEDVEPETLEYAMRLTSDLDRIRAELQVRDVRAQQNAELERARATEQLATLQARVHGNAAQPTAVTPTPAADPEANAAAAARGVTAGMIALMGERRSGVDPEAIARRATATLAETARHAPKPRVPEQRLAVTASVDIPGIAHGDSVRNLQGLADVVARKAKSMPVTRNNPNHQLVATIRNEFQHTVDDRTSAAQVEELIRHLTGPDKQQALVAGGGWCAPSEIRYDFFNIACADGMIDLPTFGVTRGGIQFPVSPSLADALAMGTSARNLILLGDPLQLAQVSQGTHPPRTGVSVLEHLLGDHPTVPPDMGLFLDRTRRNDYAPRRDREHRVSRVLLSGDAAVPGRGAADAALRHFLLRYQTDAGTS